jgi:hypothetical protein
MFGDGFPGAKTMLKTITAYEVATLPKTFNLTDGHAFRRWSAAEEAIIDRSAHLFKNNDRRRQSEIEREYAEALLRLGRQTYDANVLGYLMCFTASMAFEIIANHLRLNRLSLSLLEPCFDNLATPINHPLSSSTPLPDEE